MKKLSFFRSIYTRFLVQLIILILVIFTFLVIILTHLGIQNQDETKYQLNTSVNNSILHNIDNYLDFTSRTTQSLLSSSSLIRFLNADYSIHDNYDNYISSIQSYIQATINANPHSELYIYASNPTIPMSMDVFYHLSDIQTLTPIAEFLASDEIELWMCQEDFSGITNIFLFETSDRFIYLRKAYDSQKNFLGLIVYAIPEHYVLSFDSDKARAITADGHSRIINLTDTALDEALIPALETVTDPCTQLGNYLVRKDEPGNFPFTIYTVTAYSGYENLLLYFVLTLVFFFSLSILLYIKKLRGLVMQMNRCLSAMDTSISNNYQTRVPVSGNDEMTQIANRINLLLDQAALLLKQNIRKETSNKETKLIALQHQINPHFIYNTMEVFSSKMKLYQHYEESDAMVAFANLFRYNVATNDALVTLREELAQTRNYINIQKLRYPQIVLSAQLEEAYLSIPIPKFTLQPVIENAIMHGISEQGSGLFIALSAHMDQQYLIVQISNNGTLISEEQCRQLNIAFQKENLESDLKSGRHSIGLRNINSRLKLYFGSGCPLRLCIQDQMTTVEIRLPLTLSPVSLP